LRIGRVRMGKKVFANGMEIAHKSGDAKVMAALPDVCLSPPPPPTGPIPVPYPNTSFAKDLKEGSSTVKIGKKPLALKGQSYYKTSPLGDEAATRNFGGSIVTHTITGKTYFQASSMNVTVEGNNVSRHLDITTSNHSGTPGSTPPIPNTETKSMAQRKKDAKHGHKRGKTRHDCAGKHAWECNKAECPDCWKPPCEPNAEETQNEYNATQSGSPQERAAKGKAANQKKIDDHDEEGAPVENATIDTVGHENIEHVGYKAHCSACHMVAEIDVVTVDSVIEVKNSDAVLKRKQLVENTIPIAQTCFPGKKVVVATPKSELAKLKKTLAEKEWSPLGIGTMGV
jgi:uncharacterized Zn-binding protein involved in type VI secretion